MSRKYNRSEGVPNDVLAERLREIVKAITARDSGQSLLRECTMRIPAEVDRDADLVLSEVARRLKVNQSLYYKGYHEGREVGSQQNPSGCGCKIDEDGDTILEPCLSHAEWRDEAIHNDRQRLHCQHHPCRDVYEKGGDEKACGGREPTGCLNNKCISWHPAETDWSNCEALQLKELHKCNFYTTDPDVEWIKAKRNKPDTDRCPHCQGDDHHQKDCPTLYNDWRSQIPWEELEYDYVARDHGRWWNFEIRPLRLDFVRVWCNRGGLKLIDSTTMPNGPTDWRDTLAERPGKDG